MSINDDDLVITSPTFLPMNHTTRIGGENNRELLDISEVNSVFMPGMIKNNSDFSDVNYNQYSKIFIFNKNFNDNFYDVRVYGYNVNKNNVIKMSLEKNNLGNVILNGEELIKDRETQPSLYNSYEFTEVNSDNAMYIGNNGTLSSRTSQGVWLKMNLNASNTESALDTFNLCVKYRKEEL